MAPENETILCWCKKMPRFERTLEVYDQSKIRSSSSTNEMLTGGRSNIGTSEIEMSRTSRYGADNGTGKCSCDVVSVSHLPIIQDSGSRIGGSANINPSIIFVVETVLSKRFKKIYMCLFSQLQANGLIMSHMNISSLIFIPMPQFECIALLYRIKSSVKYWKALIYLHIPAQASQPNSQSGNLPDDVSLPLLSSIY